MHKAHTWVGEHNLTQAVPLLWSPHKVNFLPWMRFTPVKRSVTSTFELWTLSVTLSPAIQNYHVESDWYNTTLAGLRDLLWTVTCGKEECQQLLLLWHCPPRSRSASLPFNCPSSTGDTNTDQFLSAQLPLYYQVRFAWMCFQSANLGCHFVNEMNILTLAFCMLGKGLPFDLFLGELPFSSLLQKTHPYHSENTVSPFLNSTLFPFHSYS